MLCGCNSQQLTINDGSDNSSDEASDFAPDSSQIGGMVRRLGRSVSSGEGIWLSWSNSGIEFSFSGTEASAVIYSDSGFTGDSSVLMGVFIDGEAECSLRFTVGSEKSEYRLCSGLENSVHTVKLLKLSEALYGAACVESVSCDGGNISATKERELYFEFIGDSVTCGYGTLAESSRSGFAVSEEDASKTAGYILADGYNADSSFICATGFGVSTDSIGETSNVIPNVYEYTAPLFELRHRDNSALWGFERQADVIFINLGYDEQQVAVSSQTATSRFIERYISFVKTVREKNPSAEILLLCGPMSYDLADAVAKVYSELLKTDRDVHYYRFGFSCAAIYSGISAGHPSALSNQKMAAELEKCLESMGIKKESNQMS